jgi:hypothetical protein
METLLQWQLVEFLFVEAFQGMFIDIVRSRSVKGQEQESYDALQSIIKNKLMLDLFMSLCSRCRWNGNV